MRTAPRPPALDDATIEYSAPRPPPDQGILPAFKGRRDEVTPTSRGLGHEKEERTKEERAEIRWLALVEYGLVDLGAALVLLERAPNERARRSDEVEAYVVQRARAGATLRALLESGPYSDSEVVRAVGRLTAAGVLRVE